MYTAQGCIATLIQAAQRDSGSSQEGPNIVISPVQNGIDAHECRPASTAWTVVLLPFSIRIPPAKVILRTECKGGLMSRQDFFFATMDG